MIIILNLTKLKFPFYIYTFPKTCIFRQIKNLLLKNEKKMRLNDKSISNILK